MLLQRLFQQRGAQVVRQHRALAHGVHARLRARVLDLGGDIAGAEYAVIVQRLQGIAHREKALLIRRQPAGGDPGRGRRTGTPEQLVVRGARAIGQHQASGLYCRDPRVAMHANVLAL